MRKAACWCFNVLLALFVVPCAWATLEVRVVDIDGTEYTVSEDTAGGASTESTSLAYTVTSPSGTTESGVISPTGDPLVDRDPRLALLPGGGGPILVWTRNDGGYDQVAFSRFAGGAWTDFSFMTSGARHHVRPAVGVDSHGMGLLLWTQSLNPRGVLYARFDPQTGVMTTSPRNLMLELIRSGAPEWLTESQPVVPPHQRHPWIINPTPEGGNDAPAVPPASKTTSGEAAVSPSCSRAVVAVVRNRGLFIGVLENGEVIRYLRSTIPAQASDDYLELFLTGLLQDNCS